MPTQLKSDTARVNGAKSRGPKTAEGRAKSSRNATKHGMSSRNPLVLECESEAGFQAVHNAQMEIHQPATPAEKDLVDQMVAARWRILRLQSIESNLLNTAMRDKQELEREYPSGRSVILSDAYTREVNNSHAMALASRCESRLNRLYHNAYKVLRELQASRLKQSTQPAVPEPVQPQRPASSQPEKIFINKPNAPEAANTYHASHAVAQACGAGDRPTRNPISEIRNPFL